MRGNIIKFELFVEYCAHYALVILVMGFCGLLVPSFILMVGGGQILVVNFEAPRFGLELIEAKLLYGALTFIIFTLVTKAWMIEGIVNEGLKLNRLHRDAVERLKYGPAYFRRRVVAG